jgi:hypothetical protein
VPAVPAAEPVPAAPVVPPAPVVPAVPGDEPVPALPVVPAPPVVCEPVPAVPVGSPSLLVEQLAAIAAAVRNIVVPKSEARARMGSPPKAASIEHGFGGSGHGRRRFCAAASGSLHQRTNV